MLHKAEQRPSGKLDKEPKIKRRATLKITADNVNKVQQDQRKSNATSEAASEHGVTVKEAELFADPDFASVKGSVMTRMRTTFGGNKSMDDSNSDGNSFVVDADDGYAIDEDRLRAEGVSEDKITRMRRGAHTKDNCLIYPDNPRKAQWDLMMMIVLMATCIVTPLNIAFTYEEKDTDEVQMNGSKIFEYCLDFLFFIDIFVNFNSCYYEDDVDLIEDRKEITCNYLKGWFLVDFVAIIPIDIVFNVTGFTGLLRLTKIGKLSRLVKITKLIRLIRVFKIMKEQSKILSYISDFLSIGLGYERLIFFAMIFFLLCHSVACLWIIQANLSSDEDALWKGTWVEAGEFTETSKQGLYMASLYYTVTTITTVGYGDISANNETELIFCSILMLVGVISFSFANGALASIISNSDAANAKY